MIHGRFRRERAELGANRLDETLRLGVASHDERRNTRHEKIDGPGPFVPQTFLADVLDDADDLGRPVHRASPNAAHRSPYRVAARPDRLGRALTDHGPPNVCAVSVRAEIGLLEHPPAKKLDAIASK